MVSEAVEAETYSREVHLTLLRSQLLRSFDFNLLRVSIIQVTLKSAVLRSENAQAFSFVSEGVVNSKTLTELWACCILEVFVSALWVVFIYRLMKRRCSTTAFSGTIMHMAKSFVYLCHGGIIVLLVSFLTRCAESNTSFSKDSN